MTSVQHEPHHAASEPLAASQAWPQQRLRHGVQAVMFDLDGTLVDTLGDFVAALNGMVLELGLLPQASTSGFDAAQVRAWVGQGSEHLVGCALHALGHAEQTPQAQTRKRLAVASYLAHYQRGNGLASHLLPGAQSCLQGLRERGVKLACVTNKPEQAARTLLAHKGVAEFFDLIQGGDRVPEKKPHPRPLLHAAAHLGASLERTLMVGDSVFDARAARAAGCAVVIVRGGYGEMPAPDECDAIVNSLHDVLALPVLQPSLS